MYTHRLVHTHTHTHTHQLHSRAIRAETEEKFFKKRKVFKEDLKELTVFKKRKVFKEDLKELTEVEWRTETGSWFQITGAW